MEQIPSLIGNQKFSQGGESGTVVVTAASGAVGAWAHPIASPSSFTLHPQHRNVVEHLHKFTYRDQESVSFLREKPFNATGKHLVAFQGFWASFVLLTPYIYTIKADKPS